MTYKQLIKRLKKQFGRRAYDVIAALNVLFKDFPEDFSNREIDLSIGDKLQALLEYRSLNPSAPLRCEQIKPENFVCSNRDTQDLGGLLADAWDTIIAAGEVRIEIVGKIGPGLMWPLWHALSHANGVNGIYLSLISELDMRAPTIPFRLFCTDPEIELSLQPYSVPDITRETFTIVLSHNDVDVDVAIVSQDALADNFTVKSQFLVIVVNDTWSFSQYMMLMAKIYSHSFHSSNAVLVLTEEDQRATSTALMRIFECARKAPLDVAIRETLNSNNYLLFATQEILNQPFIFDSSFTIVKSPGHTKPTSFKDLKGNIRRLHIGQSKRLKKNRLLDELAIKNCNAEQNESKYEDKRYIQGQVSELSDSEVRPLTAGFVAGRQYQITVRIGPHDFLWLTDELNPFPDFELPDEERTELMIFFSEPHHAREVQVDYISLPRCGASTGCTFTFNVTSNYPLFEGRIIVVHKNRILQTALLKGSVTENSTNAGNAPSLEIEVIVLPTIAGLESRSEFDLAIVINHNADNQPRLTKISGDHAIISDIEERLTYSIRQIQSILEEVTANFETYTEGSDNKLQISDLLRGLAVCGRTLYSAIVKDEIESGWLQRHIGRIQIVAAKPDSYLPLEFIYEKPVPTDDAQLCPRSEQGLTAPCFDCIIPHGCEQSQYICPVGFWGLSRVIERHVHDPSYKSHFPNAGFALQDEPVNDRRPLQILKRYLYAPSNKVDAVQNGLTTAFKTFLDASVLDGGKMVSAWKDWEEEIASRHPTFLILMPHTLEDGKPMVPTMEIGADAKLRSPQIGCRHICAGTNCRPPVIALFGCDTAVSYAIYMGFIPPLRQNGAAVVLATLTKVLGRQVVPVAQMLIEEIRAVLDASSEPVSIGDVLLRVRKNALIAGLPMALSIIAFGDADWRLESGGFNVSH